MPKLYLEIREIHLQRHGNTLVKTRKYIGKDMEIHLARRKLHHYKYSDISLGLLQMTLGRIPEWVGWYVAS